MRRRRTVEQAHGARRVGNWQAKQPDSGSGGAIPARAGSVRMALGRRGSERCYLSLGCAVELIPHEHKPTMAWARSGGGGHGRRREGGGAERTSGGRGVGWAAGGAVARSRIQRGVEGDDAAVVCLRWGVLGGPAIQHVRRCGSRSLCGCERHVGEARRGEAAEQDCRWPASRRYVSVVVSERVCKE